MRSLVSVITIVVMVAVVSAVWLVSRTISPEPTPYMSDWAGIVAPAKETAVSGEIAVVAAAGREYPPDDSLELSYDPDSDTLTLHAREVDLAALLQRLSEETGVEIIALAPSALRRSISIDFESTPLERVLDHLLSGFPKIVVRSYSTSPNRGRIVRIFLAASEQGSDELSWELLEAVRGQRDEAATVIARTLRRSREPKAQEGASSMLERVLDTTDLATYESAVRALHELDPERASKELVDRLEPSKDADEAGRLRAAHGLGILRSLGNDGALDTLSNIAKDTDPAVALAAKNGLAGGANSDGSSNSDPGERDRVIAVVTEPYLRLTEPCNDCILVRAAFGPIGLLLQDTSK